MANQIPPTELSSPIDLLTEKQTAEILTISVSTLQQWRWRGIGLPFLKIGSAVRYRRQDLEDYIEHNLTMIDKQG